MRKRLLLIVLIIIICLISSIILSIFIINKNGEIKTKNIEILINTNDPRTDTPIIFTIDVPKKAKVIWSLNNDTIGSWNLTYVFNHSGIYNVSVIATSGSTEWIGNTTITIINKDQEKELIGGPIRVLSPAQNERQAISFVLKPSSIYPVIIFKVDLNQFVGSLELKIETFFPGGNGGIAQIRTDRVYVPQDYVYEPDISSEDIISTANDDFIDLVMEFTIINGKCDSWSIFGGIYYQ